MLPILNLRGTSLTVNCIAVFLVVTLLPNKIILSVLFQEHLWHQLVYLDIDYFVCLFFYYLKLLLTKMHNFYLYGLEFSFTHITEVKKSDTFVLII